MFSSSASFHILVGLVASCGRKWPWRNFNVLPFARKDWENYEKCMFPGRDL